MTRIRPDLFFVVDFVTPVYSVIDSTPIPISTRFRAALLYQVAGWLLLRNSDGENDAKAAAFMKLSRAQLLGEA